MGVTPAIALVHEMLLATLSGAHVLVHEMLLATLSGAHVLVHEMLLAALSGAHPLLPVAPGGALLLVLLLEMPIAATSGGALLLVLVHEMLLAALSGAHLLLPATPGGALILEMLGAPVLGMLDDQAATGALTIMVARQTTLTGLKGTTRLRFSNDKLDEIIAGMSRQTFDPQEESFGRFEATHIAAKIRGQTGTSFVPINPNGTAYLVPASTPHTAPDNSRWAARSVQNQTILTHCTGKHNTITVPASVDEAGDPVDNSGRNAVPGRPGTGGSNYPNLPPAGQVPNKQKPPMRPVAVPNGGRAPTSYAASAAQNADSSAQNADSSAQNADSSAQMDQGPTDLVERVEWLIKTTQTAEGPRPVPASFGQGWPTEGQVFGKKMGLNEQCRPGLCMSVFGYRGTPCPRGANCRSQHTWLKDDECRAIIANPLPENGGSKAGIAFLRVAVQHFVANQRLGLVDENHEVPMPPRPGRFYTLPQYQSWLASRKQRSQQRTFEQGQQTDNAGEHADHEEVESIIDSSHNTGQEPVPTPGLGASQHATASNNGHRTATNDRQGRPNTSRNGIRNPRVTGHPAANSRVFNPNASHINTDNLAYFNHTPAMGPWGGDIQSTVRQDDIAHNIEATAAEAAFIASGAPRGSFSVRYTDDAGQQATEQIDMANWKKPTVDDF
ncbi:hypothetical protein SNOG_01312 [Parastagonospora nodorum SN15]|uniref:C3H1-type domain-containing protein n=1 Tax=Phaeosphaeria nodorum (strain SN15 / ATCC MYA-4574 / FGSC 10173) TaxID=321614 RepID=Q0V3V2_PHANO|nr:hypothetical protein SNOG_01312 [Parastagonospora nodorum SN15]EAT90961.2 hypothetical protein SNOG_01312 [Parastagonospora nodorum SN15]